MVARQRFNTPGRPTDSHSWKCRTGWADIRRLSFRSVEIPEYGFSKSDGSEAACRPWKTSGYGYLAYGFVFALQLSSALRQSNSQYRRFDLAVFRSNIRHWGDFELWCLFKPDRDVFRWASTYQRSLLSFTECPSALHQHSEERRVACDCCRAKLENRGCKRAGRKNSKTPDCDGRHRSVFTLCQIDSIWWIHDERGAAFSATAWDRTGWSCRTLHPGSNECTRRGQDSSDRTEPGTMALDSSWPRFPIYSGQHRRLQPGGCRKSNNSSGDAGGRWQDLSPYPGVQWKDEVSGVESLLERSL